MKLLIVEFSSHFRIVTHLYKMFSKHFDVFLIMKQNVERTEIPNEKKIKIKNETLLYWKILFTAHKYRYIYLSTGPEFREYIRNIPFLVGFLFLIIFYRDKIILQIRNIDQYKFKWNICYIIRNLSLKLIKRITLDSKQMVSQFNKMYPYNKAYKSFVSFYYTDFIKPKYKEKTEKIAIGLIGINNYRKDYDLLLNILSKIDTSKFKLVVVGDCFTQEQINIVNKLKNYVEVDYKEKQLSEEEFYMQAIKVDIFFSPLRKELGYGITKETGNFGDAILYMKKIIIPKFVCESGEFDKIAIYYENEKKLIEIFKNINDIDLSIPNDFIEKYKSDYIFNKLKRELNLTNLFDFNN